MLGLEVALLSEQGGRTYNEDACGHWHSDSQLCCVLADGAGGHGGGHIASRVVVESLLNGFAAQPSHDGSSLERLVRGANRAVRNARVPDSERAEMYSTAVSLVIDFVHHQAHWAHAGDSRLYWFRHGRIVERTHDHSLVQALVDAGMLQPEQMRSHPKRSELRSALGTDDHELEVSASGAPRALQPGDVFLLCTDGVWEHLDDSVLEATLQQSPTPHAWLAALEDQVTEAVRDKRSHDNFTALAVWTRLAP